MKIEMRPYQDEKDYWRIRNFLRELYQLGGLLMHGEQVTDLDFWRWHYILTCGETEPVEEVTQIWETADGQVGAVLHPICHDEVRISIHPGNYSMELEEEMVAYSEEVHSDWHQGDQRILYVPVRGDDLQKQEILLKRGYSKRHRFERYWYRDLAGKLPDPIAPSGFEIRALGDVDEHPKRNWASWRVYHPGESDGNFDADFSWYANFQSAPLYRRDLDLVAVAPDGEFAAFCTSWYDDYTRSAQIVFFGVVPEYQETALGKAIILENMRQLKRLGCEQVFTICWAGDAENGIFEAVMQGFIATEQWFKVWKPQEKRIENET